MDINIEIQNIKAVLDAFQKSPNTIKSNMLLALKIALRDVQDKAQSEHDFKSRTGNLERSIKTNIISNWPVEGEVYLDSNLTKTENGESYGTFIHNGVNHEWTIEHRNKQCLRWPDGGSFRFAKYVNHPPLKADPFLYDSADNSRDKINDVFDR